MLGLTQQQWTTSATAIAGLIGALLGLFKYFNYRTKRDRIAAVGEAFEGVVDSLASDSEVKRLAAAIRLRRFFDPSSELGTARAAYAVDALGVIAGILREQPAGNFQKVLADGLAHAPSLVDADLQRTNLQGAYLGGSDVSGADFYRADLSDASLKRATATGATFYQAKLVGTVLQAADLRGANFYEADLARARFGGALLDGASFAGARDLPPEIADRLDETGRFTGAEPVRASETRQGARSVFVSKAAVLTPSQEAVWRMVRDTLTGEGLEVVTLGRDEYSHVGVLTDIRRQIAGCSAAVILGFAQLDVDTGTWRSQTREARAVGGVRLSTPWNQVEAGLAAALGLPVFVIREPAVEGGVFDLESDVTVLVAAADDALASANAGTSLARWARELDVPG